MTKPKCQRCGVSFNHPLLTRYCPDCNNWLWEHDEDYRAWVQNWSKLRKECPNTIYHLHVEEGIEPDGNCDYCQKPELRGRDD